MSSAKQTGFSSQKKKKYDRFIPSAVSKTLFASDQKEGSHSHYQELLGQKLLAPKIVPKILKFGDEADEK